MSRNEPLTNFSLSQLLEVVSTKPARQKYVEIPDEPVDPSQLKVTMIKVNKETNIVTFYQFNTDDVDFLTINLKGLYFFSENFKRAYC